MTNDHGTIFTQNGLPQLHDAAVSKARILTYLTDKKLSREEKNQKVTAIVLDSLSQVGKFGIIQAPESEGEKYTFNLKTGQCIGIHRKSDLLKSFIYHNFGISNASSHYSHLFEALKHQCFIGDQFRTASFAHFERERGVLYLPKDTKEIVEISAAGIAMKQNGTGGVYLNTSDQFRPFRYLGEGGFFGGKAIENLLFQNLNCPENRSKFMTSQEAAFLLEIYMYFILFSAAMETRPILVVQGQKGSGKSSLLKRMGKALFGESWDLGMVPRTRREFDTEISNNVFCVFDNLDRFLQRSQRDALAAIATGSGSRERELFSNRTQLRYRPRPNIAFSSRNAPFGIGDDDLVDRSILIQLTTPQQIIPENELVQSVLDNRNAVLSEMVNRIPGIIQALSAGPPVEPIQGFRMADFQHFAVRAAFPIFKGRMDDVRVSQMVRTVFKRLVQTQKAYIHNNPLHFAVDFFVQSAKQFPIKETTAKLYESLLGIAKDHHLGLKEMCDGIISFGRHMALNEKVFSERYGYSQKNGSNNKKIHTFKGMKRPALEI